MRLSLLEQYRLHNSAKIDILGEVEMDQAYLFLIIYAVLGYLAWVGIMYLIFRRGIGFRLNMIIMACATIPGIITFILGREGNPPLIAGITAVILLISLVSVVRLTANWIITPVTRAMEVASAISRGNVNVDIDVTSKDEFGDLARALRDMVTYLQEMAEAADRMAAGDITAEVRPRSPEDRLGNAFSVMLANLRGAISDIVHVSEGLAEGDLRVRPRGKYSGEFARIRESLETALHGLNQTIAQTNALTEQVVPSVEQMRAISQNLAASAEEQSAAAEEVAASLEEAEAQVRATAESTQVANQLAIKTATIAEEGQVKMRGMSEAMQAIAESSRQIARIIKVIDEIAFQTNLLALNAAVEAARAGQHGRGFAVVAQEVRNLAARSAQAARETAELIEEAGRRVGEGVAVVKETVEALSEIVNNVVKMRDLVAEIAAANEDQAQGVAQISSAVTQVNQGAQATSQQSEELASTAEELANLAEMLRAQTARFKLRERAWPEELPPGVTPDMLEQIIALVREQMEAATAQPEQMETNTTPEFVEEAAPVLDLPLDRDERGYGEF